MDIFAGPIVKIVATENFEISLTPGIHFRYDSCETSGILLDSTATYSHSYFGAGANVAINLYFTQSLYLTGKCTAAYDFIVNGAENGVSNGTTILPTLGLGFRF